MIKREYYPLDMAAEMLGCSVNYLIHLAANFKIRIHVATDGYTWPANIFCPLDAVSFVHAFYWKAREFDETCEVTEVFDRDFKYEGKLPIEKQSINAPIRFEAPYKNRGGKAVHLNKFVILREELEVIRLMPEFQKTGNAPISSEPSNSDEIKYKEVNAWLYDTWLKEGMPTGAPFLKSLKKYVNLPGSPIIDHYSAGDVAGIRWRNSLGTTGETNKKTIGNLASEFKRKTLSTPEK